MGFDFGLVSGILEIQPYSGRYTLVPIPPHQRRYSMHPATFNEEAQQWEVVVPGAEYYSVQFTSRILGMGTTQIYGCINRETIIAWRVNGVVRIAHTDLVAYIEGRGQPQAGSDTPPPTIERVIPKHPPKKKANTQGTITAAIARVNAPDVLAQALAGQPQSQGEGVPAGGLDLDTLSLDEVDTVLDLADGNPE